MPLYPNRNFKLEEFDMNQTNNNNNNVSSSSMNSNSNNFYYGDQYQKQQKALPEDSSRAHPFQYRKNDDQREVD